MKTQSQDIEKNIIIISQEQLNNHLNNGEPLQNYSNSINSYISYPFIIKKDAIEKIREAGCFTSHPCFINSDDFVEPIFTEKVKLLSLEKNIHENYELVNFIKINNNPIDAILQVNRDEFFGKYINIGGSCHLNTDNYNFETAIPALSQRDDVIFINEKNYLGSKFVNPKTCKAEELQGIITKTEYYNQNDENNLEECGIIYIPSKEFIQKSLNFAKQSSDEKCWLNGEMLNHKDYKKNEYLLTEDIILHLYLGLKDHSLRDTFKGNDPKKTSPLSRFKNN